MRFGRQIHRIQRGFWQVSLNHFLDSCGGYCSNGDTFNNFAGGTSFKCDEETGGAAVAIYKSNNCTVVKSDKESIGFMKVGEAGNYSI